MAGNFWRSSHYLEWILDKQYVLKNRQFDIRELGGEDEYQKVMIFFTGVIFQFGEKLGVRVQVIAAAVTYFRRFYAMYSLKSIDPWLLAPTTLFLSSKIEEFGLISQKTIVQTCSTVLKLRYSQYFPREYPYKIQDVLDCEFILVEVLDCSLIVYHPYRSLVTFNDNLNTFTKNQHDKTILNLSWKLLNDSLRTDLMLYYPPYMITLGCMFLATVMERRHDESIQNWFADLNVDMVKILEIVKTISALYVLWRSFEEDKEMPSLLQKMPRPKLHNNGSGSNSTSQSNNNMMNRQK